MNTVFSPTVPIVDVLKGSNSCLVVIQRFVHEFNTMNPHWTLISFLFILIQHTSSHDARVERRSFVQSCCQKYNEIDFSI